MAFFRFYVIGKSRKLRRSNPSKCETIRNIISALDGMILDQTIIDCAVVHDCSSPTDVRESENVVPNVETGEKQGDIPVKNQDEKENQSK